MVESFISVFGLHELGFPTVSPMGHSIFEEQCVLLRARGIERVTLLFDGDEAGAHGIAHAVPMLARHAYVRAPTAQVGFRPDLCSEGELRHLLNG